MTSNINSLRLNFGEQSLICKNWRYIDPAESLCETNAPTILENYINFHISQVICFMFKFATEIVLMS